MLPGLPMLLVHRPCDRTFNKHAKHIPCKPAQCDKSITVGEAAACLTAPARCTAGHNCAPGRAANTWTTLPECIATNLSGS
jgi:hypothetical protein